MKTYKLELTKKQLELIQYALIERFCSVREYPEQAKDADLALHYFQEEMPREIPRWFRGGYYGQAD